MRYFLALVFPPLAALIYGGLGTCILNVLLCFLAIVPGIIHAILVVNKHDKDKMHNQMMAALQQQTQLQIAQLQQQQMLNQSSLPK